MASRKTESDATHVSFRLPNPAIAAELASRAKSVGASPNLYARELLVTRLLEEDERSHELRALALRLDSVERGLASLQQLLAAGFHALLVHGCQVQPSVAQELRDRLVAPSQSVPAGNLHAQSQEDGARL